MAFFGLCGELLMVIIMKIETFGMRGQSGVRLDGALVLHLDIMMLTMGAKRILL